MLRQFKNIETNSIYINDTVSLYNNNNNLYLLTPTQNFILSSNSGFTGPQGSKGNTGSRGPTGSTFIIIGPTGPTGIGGDGANTGTIYGNYMFWNPSNTGTWQLGGNTSVFIGVGTGPRELGNRYVILGIQNLPSQINRSDFINIGTNSGDLILATGGFINIGKEAGRTGTTNTPGKISIGNGAGQGQANSISIGNLAHSRANGIGLSNILIGNNSGFNFQGNALTAIGPNSGYNGIIGSSILIGSNAGFSNSQNNVRIGTNAGYSSPNLFCTAIGFNAGYTGQGPQTKTIGFNSGSFFQGSNSIAIGSYAGQTSQGGVTGFSVAIGSNAGNNQQRDYMIAIGTNAGQTSQGITGGSVGGISYCSIAIGTNAGQSNQNGRSIAIGTNAGSLNQGVGTGYGIAIGTNAGQYNQNNFAIALGYNAGSTGQGPFSVCIGPNAGTINAPTGSIILNASSIPLNPITEGFFVFPINSTGTSGSSNILQLNTAATSAEILATTAKTFIIPHPFEEEKYLMHSCLEGPEVGVFYRGKGKIINGQSIINLPKYTKNFITDISVQINAIYNKNLPSIKLIEVNTSGNDMTDNYFKVIGDDCEFYWIVYGKRNDLQTEINKNIKINGKGPYTWIR